MKVRKRMGPNMEPWTTPCVRGRVEEPPLTTCLLSPR